MIVFLLLIGSGGGKGDVGIKDIFYGSNLGVGDVMVFFRKRNMLVWRDVNLIDNRLSVCLWCV